MNRKDRRAAEKGGANGSRPAGESDRLFALALQCHQTGKFSDAEGMYRHILSGNPRHADAQHLLGVLALQSGRPQVAAELIGKAIALNSRAPSFHSNLAEALRILGRYDEAVSHLEEALKLDARSAEAQLTLGNVRQLQGRFEEAIAAYRRAIALRPDYGDAHLNLGVVMMDQDLAAATTHLRRALALKPRAPEAFANLAIALATDNQFDDAIAHYRRSLELRPDHPETVMNLGNALLGCGLVEEAAAHYDAALGLMARRANNQDPDLSPIDGLWMALQGKRAPHFAEENCLMSVVRTACLRTPPAEWRAISDKAAKIEGLSAAARYELAVRRAIAQWLTRDARLSRTLDEAAGIAATLPEPITKNVRNSRGYAEFLQALVAHGAARHDMRGADSSLAPLFVVGDSHCLAYDGLAVTLGGVSHATTARLVMGAKAFHLGEPRPNQYKWLLAKVVNEIPPGAPLVLSLGEIDCRIDEGILPFYKKSGGDLDALVRDQVSHYVAHVESVTRPQNLRLHFLGVPAPYLSALLRRHPELADPADQKLLVRIIQSFNGALSAVAQAGGYKFLDIYAVSAGADGSANGAAHVDDYHLKPETLAQVMG